MRFFYVKLWNNYVLRLFVLFEIITCMVLILNFTVKIHL